MLVRILTENKNYQDVVKLVGKYFNGATIIKADGLWQGNIKHSLVIEIDDKGFSGTLSVSIEQIVYAIKKLNDQDKILVQYIEPNSVLI